MKRELKSAAALAGRTLKDYAGDVLREAVVAYRVNSKPVAVPAESVAQQVAVAAQGLLPTRATGESTVAKLPRGKAGRKGKGAQR